MRIWENISTTVSVPTNLRPPTPPTGRRSCIARPVTTAKLHERSSNENLQGLRGGVPDTRGRRRLLSKDAGQYPGRLWAMWRPADDGSPERKNALSPNMWE